MKDRKSPLPVIGPHPTRCRSTLDPEAVDRRLDCQHYDTCLDIADGWPNFHCRHCTAHAPLTAAQRYRDHIGHLELLAETQLLAEVHDDAPPFDDEECRDDDEDEGRHQLTARHHEVCAGRVGRRR